MPLLSTIRIFLLALACAVFAPLDGAWGESTKPDILVTLPFQADFVERLAGEFVSVHVLIPAGANHETFEASIGQLTALSKASLYFTIGHPAFTFESKILSQLGSGLKAKIIDGSKGIALNPSDIHYWTSPKRLMTMNATYAAALKELLPEKAAAITAGEAAVHAELKKLDGDLEAMFRPYKSQTFLVFHPAWGYLAADYGLNQLAIEKDGKEPGIVESQKVIDRAKELGLKTVFSERGSAHESTNYVLEQLGARAVELDPVAPNWIENLRDAAIQIKLSFQGPFAR